MRTVSDGVAKAEDCCQCWHWCRYDPGDSGIQVPGINIRARSP